MVNLLQYTELFENPVFVVTFGTLEVMIGLPEVERSHSNKDYQQGVWCKHASHNMCQQCLFNHSLPEAKKAEK